MGGEQAREVLHDVARDVERGNIGDQVKPLVAMDMILRWDLCCQRLYVCVLLRLDTGPVYLISSASCRPVATRA